MTKRLLILLVTNLVYSVLDQKLELTMENGTLFMYDEENVLD